MLRAVVSGIRLTLFVLAFFSFLVSRLFLDGGVFGIRGPAELLGSFALSFFAALGLFLCVVGLWTFRLESHVREVRIFRLLVARVVLGIIGGACILVLAIMAFFPMTAQYVTAAGIVLSLVGMAAVLAQPKAPRPGRAGVR